MAVTFATYTEAQTDTELVAAQPGKLIRVLKLLVTSWGNVKITLLSDPAGAPTVALTPELHATSGKPVVLCLGRRYALATQLGKALGITTAFQVGATDHSVIVWYEVVS